MNGRLALSSILVVAVTATLLLFVRLRLVPGDVAAPPAGADVAARAAAAHARAGVDVPAGATAPSDVGGGVSTDARVREAFQARRDALTAGVRNDPDDPALRRRLARLLHDGHRLEDALPHYREALRLDPDDAATTYDLASAYAELGAWSEAEGVLRDRLDRAPDDAVALYDLAAVRANRGDADGAREWLRRARDAAADPVLRERAEDALRRLAARGGGAG